MDSTDTHRPGPGPVKSILVLLGSVLFCLGAGAVGALFPPGGWYASLQKPSWTPPNWLFGPVWTLLYLLMAVSAWLVWREGGLPRQARPLAFFLAQLAANAVWSWFCFGLHRLGLAFLDLALLWVWLAITIFLFWKVRKTAAVLLLPYLLWVSFAGALNLALWRLNP